MTEFEMAENEEPKAPEGAQKKNTPAMALALERLRMNPEATYQDIKDAAVLAGIQVPPIVFGRARSLLGLAPMKPPRVKRREIEEAPIRYTPPVAAPTPFPPGVADAPESEEVEEPLRAARTAKPRRAAPAGLSTLDLDALVTSVRELERERDDLREALDQIAEILRRFE